MQVIHEACVGYVLPSGQGCWVQPVGRCQEQRDVEPAVGGLGTSCVGGPLVCPVLHGSGVGCCWLVGIGAEGEWYGVWVAGGCGVVACPPPGVVAQVEVQEPGSMLGSGKAWSRRWCCWRVPPQRKQTHSGCQLLDAWSCTGAHAIWRSGSSRQAVSSSGLAGFARKRRGQHWGWMWFGGGGGWRPGLRASMGSRGRGGRPDGVDTALRKSSRKHCPKAAGMWGRGGRGCSTTMCAAHPVWNA